MKILFEQNLVNTLRKLMNASKERVWISSPYIGSYLAIKKIMGNKWQSSPKLSVRLLTDIEECTKISLKTLSVFYKAGAIRTLHGLHAKIYIIDNNAIVTSANLTGTAFSKRYEMGTLLNGSEANDVIIQYNKWWKNKSNQVTLKEIKNLKQNNRDNSSENNSSGLKKLWKLPAEGKKRKLPATQGTLVGFEHFVSCYKDLAKIYNDAISIDSKIPLFLEIDGFLDYLFHHGSKPSSKYARVLKTDPILPRKLKNKEEEIVKWAKKYKEWEANINNKYWRVENSELIRTNLDIETVGNLSWKDVKNIADSLNCMNSFPINKAGFLNKSNNDLRNIKKGFKELIHGENDIKTRLHYCKKQIKFFGDSSVQELIGFYFPNKYPIRNGNSNAGLRYLGYDVTI